MNEPPPVDYGVRTGGVGFMAIVMALLAFATAWSSRNGRQRCVPDFAQFPRWLGCAIATHESLAGALIATAGALFAAWLAFSGLQDQIGLAQKTSLRPSGSTAEKSGFRLPAAIWTS